MKNIINHASDTSEESFSVLNIGDLFMRNRFTMRKISWGAAMNIQNMEVAEFKPDEVVDSLLNRTLTWDSDKIRVCGMTDEQDHYSNWSNGDFFVCDDPQYPSGNNPRVYMKINDVSALSLNTMRSTMAYGDLVVTGVSIAPIEFTII